MKSRTLRQAENYLRWEKKECKQNSVGETSPKIASWKAKEEVG
jgi:hypothetical protein